MTNMPFEEQMENVLQKKKKGKSLVLGKVNTFILLLLLLLLF